MDWKKNVIYSGLAAVAGVGGYLLGRSKSMRGVSLTLMAISMVLYMPRGCQMADKYMDNKNYIERRQMELNAKKDSMENILNYEHIKKDSIYQHYNSLIKKDHATIDGRIIEINRGTKELKNEINRGKKELQKFHQDVQSERNQLEKDLEKYYENDN